MSIWQTSHWQDMLIASGQSEEYFIIEQNVASLSSEEREFKGEVLSQEETKKIFVEKRRVSLGEYALFVIGYEGEIDERLQDTIQHLCSEEKCLFAQIETIDYSVSLSFKERETNGEGVGEENTIFSPQRYYKKFIPSYTCLIDLSMSEEEILAAMKQKGRYNIKLAKKKGVRVEQVEKNNTNIEIFFRLVQDTTQRDNFSGNTQKFYEIFLEKISDSQLFFAYHEDEVIAGGIFVQENNVMTYYYGASANHKRNLMAPYLLQWTAISQAKQLGSKLYDFLGVAHPGEKNSPLAGVTDFKKKFSPEPVKVSESFLYIHKKWKYWLIQFLKKFN